MNGRVYRPVTPPRDRTVNDAGYTRGRPYALAFVLWCGVFALIFCSGCGTTLESATCPELAEAADKARCPERVIEKPVPQPAPIRIDSPEEAPALTTAALENPTTVEALRAAAADLANSRSWGWRLFYRLENIKRANDALAEVVDDP